MLRDGQGCAATYRGLRRRRILDLLGQWVSELEPIVFDRVDVSPQILVEVGVGASGAARPTFVAQVTVQEMIDAGALER